jgi:hypothetical protein
MPESDYRAYVLRHWRRDDGSERVEVEHVQSGARARLASLAEALAWIDAGAAGAPGPPAADRPSPPSAPDRPP